MGLFRKHHKKKHVSAGRKKHAGPLRLAFSKKGIFGSKGVLVKKHGVLDKVFTPVLKAEAGVGNAIGGIGDGVAGVGKMMSNPLILVGVGVVAIVVIPRVLGRK